RGSAAVQAPAQPSSGGAPDTAPAAPRTVSWGAPNAPSATQPAPSAWPGAPGAPPAPQSAPPASVPASGRTPIPRAPAPQGPAQGGVASTIGSILTGDGRRQGLGEAIVKSL